MNLHELAAEIHKVNRANGFDDPTWENLPTKLMLVVTELDEAAQSVKGVEYDPFPEELADVAIRTLDILTTLWPGDWCNRCAESPREPDRYQVQCAERTLWPLVHLLCRATEYWRYNNFTDVKITLEFLIQNLFRVATLYAIDLEYEIRVKVGKNAQRGHLHGKARSDG